jgi:hypothetical protein
MSVLGQCTLEKHKDLTSRVNIHIAKATSITQRIFKFIKEKFTFFKKQNWSWGLDY